VTKIVESLDEIAGPYRALFVDLWGCLHDGVRAFPDAVAALHGFRARGGRVVLLTNAPRPRAEVAAQIAGLGVPGDAWDVIVTSGDAARVALFQGAVGRRVRHIGEARDEGFFRPPRIVERPADIARVPLDEAEGIVCTGPFDPHAPPETLRGELLLAKTRDLPMLCANPDIVVDRGDSREYCAGAVAALYEEMGGRALYFGKPHPPIYDLARTRLAPIEPVTDEAILCIGDGLHTDIAGATGEGLDALFVTGGLEREATGTNRQPDAAALERVLKDAQLSPAFAIGALR